MPIEIRELHIKTEVSEKGNNPGTSSAQPGGNASAPSDANDIISACIEKVLEILELKKER